MVARLRDVRIKDGGRDTPDWRSDVRVWAAMAELEKQQRDFVARAVKRKEIGSGTIEQGEGSMSDRQILGSETTPDTTKVFWA